MEELAVQYVLSADQQNNNVFSFILIDNLKKNKEKGIDITIDFM